MSDERRVRVVRAEGSGTGPVVYVMARDMRVSHNWALNHAGAEARKRSVPLLVLFVIGPSFRNFSLRHNVWLIESLKNVEQNLRKCDISFVVRSGAWDEEVIRFAKEVHTSLIVFDQNPIEPVRTWRARAAHKLSCAVHEVDAHNIIPVWHASDKAEFAAYTFRPKVRKWYREFAGIIPRMQKQKHRYTGNLKQNSWEELQCARTNVVQVPLPQWITPGEDAGKKALKRFIRERLSRYHLDRNDPTKHAQSDLSPYIRWGNLSAQHIAYEVERAQGVSAEAKAAFLEELVVRRELAENYVYYTKRPDTLAAAHPWAKETLMAHVNDLREFHYSYKELEAGKTHDPLWNAAQREMVVRGKMHGYLRMYWAKKILEWTRTPEEAIRHALRLNDTYELDGRDSNGIAGIMWSIAGVHDRPWFERPVFGKIRYMNERGCRRKFDVDTYIEWVNTLT